MPLSALLLSAVPLTLPQEPPSHAASSLREGEAPPTIDGVLDEALWERIPPLTGLRQVLPETGAPASERTEVRFCFGPKELFLGVSCFDSEPEQIRQVNMSRDARLNPDDRFELILDTFNDDRNAFWFQMSAAGSRGDALITKNGSSFNKPWNGLWKGRTTVTDEGYFSEMAIPYATLNFDPEASEWGFNIRRHIRRKEEESRWATPSTSIYFFSAAHAGALLEVPKLEQGLGLDVMPFLTADGERDRTTSETDTNLDAGLDLLYRFSPSTKLSVSLNTDFAETEVDDRRVNLTRFPLYYQEKRDFFLEDSGVFFFGPSTGRGNRGGDLSPFFSRRIGLYNNREVPLDVAARFTTQTDGYSLGLLNVQAGSLAYADEDGDPVSLDSQSLFVGRFSKNLGEQSDAGVLWTHGNPEGGDGATIGADLNYRTDEFLDDKNLRFSAYGITAENGADSDEAYYASASYPNDTVDLSLSFTEIGEDFDPALGFVPRGGIRKYSGSFDYSPRPRTNIRQIGVGLHPTVYTDLDGNVESERVHATLFRVEWESGDSFDLDVKEQREVLTEAWDIQDDVEIAVGDYEYLRWGLEYETSSKRPISLETGVDFGEFYDGDRLDYGIELDWNLNPGTQLGLEFERNEVELSGGTFDVNVLRLRADLQFSPDTSWFNFVQYDDESEDVGLNSRLWHIFEPGKELFIVLNQSWNTMDDRFAPERTGLALKFGYTLRF
ncbi:MAG: carbohydrate binding family 9 domain-containing protein [Planctomycetes bacterium]|nr:carbohydrate binding family 9 domain-containing protein [Planctomycetota bacterium]